RLPGAATPADLARPGEEAQVRARDRVERATHPTKADPFAGPAARTAPPPLCLVRGPIRIRSGRQRDDLGGGEHFSSFGIPRHRARVSGPARIRWLCY